nr:MAG TPA: hypothetical protein [Caudoviricetes sp.]
MTHNDPLICAIIISWKNKTSLNFNLLSIKLSCLCRTFLLVCN